ncbi:uncharacterized protein LOC111873097 isoform X1 [Cryptotermes secundus]|uniref:uncharacterized protein LOC111873097 isoform X1 n=1 Tax=Cryptotermes secundus TaxID=105785 RepID=UPI000CD7B818|nr:uncharacterized protein LOC111873097 isoform X1 [Cryptotermes secundus]
MRTRAIVVLSVVAFVALLIPQTHGRPYRQKRVSDQRLAELETYMALRKMAGKLVTVPLGFGQVDPAKIGRRRRRSLEVLLQELRSPSAQGGPDAYPVLTDNNENEEDAGEFIASHQSLPEFLHRVQI